MNDDSGEGMVHPTIGMGTYKGIPFFCNPGLHEACLNALVQVLGPAARILDLGAGYGAFSRRLLEAGYTVEAADLDPGGWMVPEVPVRQINLNEPLGHEGEPYDGIAAIEVIEHLHNPYKFLRDCRELIKRGGILVLSTPNILDLDSRRLFLTRGEFYGFRKDTLRRSGHTTILPPWLMRDILRMEGWQLLKEVYARTAKARPWPQKVLSPLCNLLLLPLAFAVPVKPLFAGNVIFVAKCLPPNGRSS